MYSSTEENIKQLLANGVRRGGGGVKVRWKLSCKVGYVAGGGDEGHKPIL